ncbi:hypothetical protein Tco_1274401 [Tanacetum coccineum]
MTTAGTRAVVNTGKGKMDTDLKKSRWVWRPKGNYLDHVSKDSGSFMLKKGNPEILYGSVVDDIVHQEKEKGPTHEYIRCPLQPHRNKSLVRRCFPQLIRKNLQKVLPMYNYYKKQRCCSQGRPTTDEAVNLEEEKRRIASQKKAAQATSTNILSTDRPSVSTDRPFVSTDRPSVSIASTTTGTNTGESSFVYLGGKIPIDASTLPNADLPIDHQYMSVTDSTTWIQHHFYRPKPTLKFIDSSKGQILGDPTSTVQTRGKIQKASSAQQTLVRPDIMFAVCACARFQVTPKASHLNAVKRIFRYLKHQPKLGLWYPRDSPFELEAFLDSDYGGASLDKKSTIDTMVDVNVNAPAEQAPAMAPPTHTDDQILPCSRWVPHTNFFRAFTASSTIPSIYIQQFWDTVRYVKNTRSYSCQLDKQWFNLTKDTLKDAIQIKPVDNNNPFSSPPTPDALINFVNELGYPKAVRTLSAGKKKANPLVIPSVRFTKLIIHHLQSKHKFHPRPDSPLHLPYKEYVLGYLKFSAKGTKREVFGMPIPNDLITDDIRGEHYYNEYLEKVAKHQRYLASEEVSVPDKEPVYGDEEADTQREIEESLKEVHDAHRGLLPPVEIREPGSRKFQPLLDVQGEGKEKVSHDESSLLYAELGLTDSETESDEEVPGTDAGDQDEGQARPNPGIQDEGRAGLNPSDAAFFVDQFLVEKSHEDEPEKTNTESEVQSMVMVPIHQDTSSVPLMTTPVIDLIVSQPVTTTVSKAVDKIVMDAVDWAIQAPLRDHFRDLPEADMKEILHHRMWETKSYKAHEDHKKPKKKRRHESPKIPPGSPPHQPPPPSPPAGPSGTLGASGASRSSQLPPPPPHLSTNQSDQSKGTAAPSSLKTTTSSEYTAWTTTDTRLKPFVSLIPEDLHMDADSAPDEQVHSSDDEDIRNDHIPKVNLKQDWWKPLYEENRPATLEPAWSIPSSDMHVPMNN